MKPTTTLPTPSGETPSGGLFQGLVMDDIRDLRDRLARAEQDIKNGKETFTAFKHDDFSALKTEVHTMRKELNTKVDELLDKVSAINLTMAKWMGAGGVVIFVGQVLMGKFLK